MFVSPCPPEVIGLIAEWPLARQEKSRQAWQAERIRRRREENEREE